MRGKLSCPVLKAGRRERSLLPSYQNRSHYRRDVTLGEDHSQVRSGCAPQILAALNNTVLALMDFLHVPNVPNQMRFYQAHPLEALRLLLVKL